MFFLPSHKWQLLALLLGCHAWIWLEQCLAWFSGLRLQLLKLSDRPILKKRVEWIVWGHFNATLRLIHHTLGSYINDFDWYRPSLWCHNSIRYKFWSIGWFRLNDNLAAAGDWGEILLRPSLIVSWSFQNWLPHGVVHFFLGLDIKLQVIGRCEGTAPKPATEWAVWWLGIAETCPWLVNVIELDVLKINV